VLTEQLPQIWNEVRSSIRYKWTALLVAIVVCGLGWTAVLMLPDQYESRAQVYVTSDTILKPLLQGIAISTDTGSAADVVRRALLARPNIERVANEVKLLERAKDPQQVEAVYERLGKNIKIASADPRLNLYVVSYTGDNAVEAQAVVQTLVDSFEEESVGQVRTDTEEAVRFLEQQVEEYRVRLAADELELAEFKKKHIGLMPTQSGDYFSRLQDEQTALDTRQSEYNVAVRQRDELRRKLMGTSGTGRMPEMPTDKQIQKATEIDAQLQDARRRLETLLLKYTDKHPDVTSLRETIERLEEQRRTELGGVRATSPGAPGSPGGMGSDSVMQSLQVQLNAADVQVVTLQAQVGEVQRRVNELRRLLSVGTEVEAQLADLNRGYNVTKTQYDSLLQRLEAAKISGDADESQDMKLKVMEPARVPPYPIGPMRTVMILGMTFAGLVVGGLVAFLLGRMRPVFVDVKEITDDLGLRVVGAISALRSRAEASSKRRGNLLFALAASGFAAVSVGLVLFGQVASGMLRTVMGAT
jgi:polysaccharide chain length determinant protein (PEP-CTERM system associated)